MSLNDSPVRILALDGGGLRAAFSLSILQKLEDVAKRPLHTVFDLIIGTSTGAILTFGIGYKKFSPAECLESYRKLGEIIFPTSMWNDIWGKVRDVWQGAYWDAEQLEQAMKDLFGSSTVLSSINNFPPHLACVAAECSQSPGGVVVFSTYNRDNMPFAGTDDVKIWQAIRASTAAPTFFDVFHLRNAKLAKHFNGRQTLLDGGLLANNPALVGLLEARRLFPDRLHTVVSVGTGRARTTENVSEQWWSTSLRVALNTAMSSEMVDATLQAFPSNTYFRINGNLKRAEEMDRYECFDYWKHEGEKVAAQYDKWNEVEAALR